MKVDQERLWTRVQELGLIGATPEGGVTRVGFSTEERRAMESVAVWMEDAGLSVRWDAAGNLVGRASGAREDAPVIALGSHVDTVPNGGRFDGALGVLSALEAVQALREQGYAPGHALEVIVFVDEEGARFGRGLVGSRLASGTFDLAAWTDATDRDGRTIREVFRERGIDLDRAVSEARRDPATLATYLELHIEQGEVLERSGDRIGVVTGIVGISRFEVTFTGQADHAGATPMTLRRDALVSAARFVTMVDQFARAAPQPLVATVGRITVEPNVANVVPGRVVVTFEVRALETQHAEDVIASVIAATQANATVDRVDVSFHQVVHTPPLLMAQDVQEACLAACRKLDVPHRTMPSGGGHDAMVMGTIAPVGMVFVPSRRGISHAPDEYTAPEDAALGAQVLLEAIVQLDEAGVSQAVSGGGE